MARAGAGGLNVGRAAILIVVALFIGIFVLKQGDDAPSLSSSDLSPNTTIPTIDDTSDTTAPRVAVTVPTTVATRVPNSFKTIAINATNTGGVGGKATTKLTAAGYNALAPGDATSSVKASTKTSLVLYAAGFEREAALVVSLFGLPSSALRPLTTPPPSVAVKDSSIVLLVGPDLKF